jgi:hypothetical protein
VIARGLVVMVRGYQVTFGALLPPVCRYDTPCSRYLIQALQRHGAVRGGWLTVRRLVRCNPWGGMGYDPVPD